MRSRSRLWRWSTGVLLGWLLFLPVVMQAAPARLTIAFTADTDGEFEPCGCPGSPVGGFARRATLLKSLARTAGPLIIVDAGNVVMRGARVLDDKARRDAAHAELMASLLSHTGVQAVAVGARDLWALGPAGVKKLAQNQKIPWVSANVTGPGGGLLFTPSRVLEASGLKVGVIGLTDPQNVVARDGVTFRDPVGAAREQVAKLRSRVDLVLVLSNLSIEGNDAVREQVPGIDLILTAAPTASELPRVGGRRAPFIVRVGAEGRAVGRVDLRLGSSRARTLIRSEAMERRLADLESTRQSIESLRVQIVQEEGRFNAGRFEKESQLLREQLELLSREKESADDARIFGYRELPLHDRLADDPWMSARIRAYKGPEGAGVEGGKPRSGAVSPGAAGKPVPGSVRSPGKAAATARSRPPGVQPASSSTMASSR